METSSHKHDLSVTHSVAPPLSLEDGRQGWKFQVSNYSLVFLLTSPLAVVVKNLLANAGDIRDACSIPGLGRSPGGGHGNPLQYSCLENPMDIGAWRAIGFIGWKRVGLDWSNLACMHVPETGGRDQYTHTHTHTHTRKHAIFLLFHNQRWQVADSSRCME